MSTIEFNNQFGKLNKILLAFAYNLTKNLEDAEDLFQETAYRAINNLDKFRTGTNLKAWLFTIMKNIFINNYRKKAKKKTIVDTTDNLYYINSGSSVVANGSESSILLDELSVLIEKLDQNLKVPFLMHFEGYKYQEIADELELPLGTVKSRIFFARKELQQNVNRMYGGRPRTRA